MNTKIKLATHVINTSILLSLSGLAIADTDKNTDTMVVTASGFSQQIKEAPATISVITPEEISKKPYRDVTDALKDIPGITITGGGDSTDISIRGMDAKYTLLLIDGKKVSTRETRPNSDNSGFEQGWLPPLTAIDRIEVVRGPMSSLYGSDAMGGVVNIITKKVSNKWHSGIRVESIMPYRSDEKNTYVGSFSTMGPIIDDILGIQLYGQYTNRHEDRFLNGHSGQKLRSLNGKISLNATDTQKFDFDFGRSLQNSTSTRGKTRDKSRKDDYKRDNARNTFALTHNGMFGDVSTTSFIAYEENNNPARQMKIKNTDVDTHATIPFSINMLTVGGKYNYQELHDKGNELNSNITKIDRWNYALYAEDEISIFDNWNITAGLRYNKDENYGSNWNPRIYSVWNIDDNFTMKGGYSTGFATPQLRQVVSDWGQVTGGGFSNGVVVGNPDLKPEKSDNFEIGLAYTNDYGIDASATAFYTKYKDKIQSYYICDTRKIPNRTCKYKNFNKEFDFIQGRENVDKADLKGIELTFKTPLFTDFLLSSNYSWTETEQKTGKNKGKPLNRTPKQKFNTQLDWNLTQELDLWTKVAYYGVETTTDRSGKKIEYPGYTFWDVGASFQINKNAKVYGGVYNLFDKDVSNDDFGKTLEGRRYFIGTEINF
ncbi:MULTISPECIES: TonB-dependent receptor domain-containing protein [unclassified Gilliamella]|uniref:TonB-dependent receptor domain-containing protein n=1 Tax=unclassified Gilliamella TaxID=2685620 RepID=UPI002269B714|nr:MULTISPECIES: TonB-dependent receptor [unclassified Gilliamella]MCX8583559.1 TonB-dependent receptor [Gilliamella sp. B3372]MCX8593964.1 TonB-dependent receptor [Gilliamella sp. B3367]